MTQEINTYFAVLIITIWGSLATVLILRAIDSSMLVIVFGSVSNSAVAY